MNQEIISRIVGVVNRYRHRYRDPIETIVARAMDGGIEAAEELYWHASEQDRAELMVLMFVYRAPREALRAMLMRVWDHEHGYLIQKVGIGMVKEIFRRADFPVPEGLPATLTVYRGGYGITQRKLSSGLSWTTNRDVACFFAMRCRGYKDWHTPMLLKATIRRDAIKLMEPDHRESEVVIFGARGSVIDGDVADWTRRCEVYQAEMLRRWNQLAA